MQAATASPPRIGLVLGDSSGIGPEVCAKHLAAGGWRERVHLLAIGDSRIFAQGMRDAAVDLLWRTCEHAQDVDWGSVEVPLLDLRNADPAVIRRGAVSAEAGRAAGETLARAAELALSGAIDGITYAPLNKGALNAGGWHYPDDLHLFAALTKYDGPAGAIGELNVQQGLWTSRVTSHVPLREVARWVTPESVGDAIDLIHRTLRQGGLTRPRIAVAALNPHAGDNGLCGDEELTVIGPAVAAAQTRGIAAEGPFAADTIFLRARAGAFDAVVSMYHDQGQVATKLLGFNRGVTVLAGLPIVLTTPAHGTAHDIVGQGKADPGALEQAVLLAGQLARRRTTGGA
jgi:4-hydroxythreonine-4-phosphate dehydrogenase